MQDTYDRVRVVRLAMGVTRGRGARADHRAEPPRGYLYECGGRGEWFFGIIRNMGSDRISVGGNGCEGDVFQVV